MHYNYIIVFVFIGIGIFTFWSSVVFIIFIKVFSCFFISKKGWILYFLQFVLNHFLDKQLFQNGETTYSLFHCFEKRDISFPDNVEIFKNKRIPATIATPTNSLDPTSTFSTSSKYFFFLNIDL